MRNYTRALLLVFGVAATITLGIGAATAATCYGNDPCNACKNCRYCKRCATEGGTCGVCKARRAAQRKAHRLAVKPRP